jgi:hypothetical protein
MQTPHYSINYSHDSLILPPPPSIFEQVSLNKVNNADLVLEKLSFPSINNSFITDNLKLGQIKNLNDLIYKKPINEVMVCLDSKGKVELMNFLEKEKRLLPTSETSSRIDKLVNKIQRTTECNVHIINKDGEASVFVTDKREIYSKSLKIKGKIALVDEQWSVPPLDIDSAQIVAKYVDSATSFAQGDIGCKLDGPTVCNGQIQGIHTIYSYLPTGIVPDVGGQNIYVAAVNQILSSYKVTDLNLSPNEKLQPSIGIAAQAPYDPEKGLHGAFFVVNQRERSGLSPNGTWMIGIPIPGHEGEGQVVKEKIYLREGLVYSALLKKIINPEKAHLIGHYSDGMYATLLFEKNITVIGHTNKFDRTLQSRTGDEPKWLAQAAVIEAMCALFGTASQNQSHNFKHFLNGLKSEGSLNKVLDSLSRNDIELLEDLYNELSSKKRFIIAACSESDKESIKRYIKHINLNPQIDYTIPLSSYGVNECPKFRSRKEHLSSNSCEISEAYQDLAEFLEVHPEMLRNHELFVAIQRTELVKGVKELIEGFGSAYKAYLTTLFQIVRLKEVFELEEDRKMLNVVAPLLVLNLKSTDNAYQNVLVNYLGEFANSEIFPNLIASTKDYPDYNKWSVNEMTNYLNDSGIFHSELLSKPYLYCEGFPNQLVNSKIPLIANTHISPSFYEPFGGGPIEQVLGSKGAPARLVASTNHQSGRQLITGQPDAVDLASNISFKVYQGGVLINYNTPTPDDKELISKRFAKYFLTYFEHLNSLTGYKRLEYPYSLGKTSLSNLQSSSVGLMTETGSHLWQELVAHLAQ